MYKFNSEKSNRSWKFKNPAFYVVILNMKNNFLCIESSLTLRAFLSSFSLISLYKSFKAKDFTSYIWILRLLRITKKKKKYIHKSGRDFASLGIFRLVGEFVYYTSSCVGTLRIIKLIKSFLPRKYKTYIEKYYFREAVKSKRLMIRKKILSATRG